MFGVRDRPANKSCDGVISGTPGCADLFFLRVFIERVKGVAESWRAINKRRCWGNPELTCAVFMLSGGKGTWSVSVRVIIEQSIG